MLDKIKVKEKLNDLLDKVKELDDQIRLEVKNKQKEFFYTINEKKVRFGEAVKKFFFIGN